MKTRNVGTVELTELGFGGASLGNLYRETSDADARAAVDAAWDVGIRYFDTAPHYGLGLSERRLGAALSQRPRAEFVVSTKVGRVLERNPRPSGSDLAAGGFAVPDDLVRRFDFSADAVRRSLDGSLERLGLDRVDVVYVHDPDDHVDQAIGEALPALARLRDEGVVRAIGVGMNSWRAPLRMVREVDLDVVMLAGRWTLLDRTGEALVRECDERSVRLVAAAPFNSGLLAQDRPDATRPFNYASPPTDVLATTTALADVCERHGTRLPVAAVQFPLQSRAVASVVCGLRTAAEVRDAADRLTQWVPPDVWAEVDAVLGAAV